MERTDKHNYYLNMADTALQRATCLRRKFGAVIIKNDTMQLSTKKGGKESE